MKELLAEEKDLMMMSTTEMNEEQLTWWKEMKADIMERKSSCVKAVGLAVVLRLHHKVSLR